MFLRFSFGKIENKIAAQQCIAKYENNFATRRWGGSCDKNNAYKQQIFMSKKMFSIMPGPTVILSYCVNGSKFVI